MTNQLNNALIDSRKFLTETAAPPPQAAAPEPFATSNELFCEMCGQKGVRRIDEGARPLYEAPQPQADAMDAERYRWLRDEWLNSEPEAINMGRAKGRRGLDAVIDAAIAAAKENK